MNKRFISLFLAVLMLVTMMPINKVRAEDGEDSYINVNNGFKESMVIDDPANFEYLKYLAENYEFGTNDNMITQSEAHYFSKHSNILPNHIFFVNPNEEGEFAESYYKVYKEAIAEDKEDVDGYNVFYSRDKYKPNLGFVLSPAFKKPIISTGGWVMMTPEKFLEEYNFFAEKAKGYEFEPGDAVNSFNDTGGYYAFVKTNESDAEPYGMQENWYRYLPDNISHVIIPDNIEGKNLLKYENEKIVFDNSMVFSSDLYKLNKSPLWSYISDNYNDIKDVSNYYLLSNNYMNGLKTCSYSYNVILEYNHPAIYKADSNLSFKSKREEGTKNLIKESADKLMYLEELNNLDKSDVQYDIISSLYKTAEENEEIDKKNVETYFNSEEWSTTPLTIYIGNVDKQIEEVPYKTIEKEDDTLLKGETEIEVKGKNGSKTTITTYEVNEATGELENPVVTYENVEPVDEVVLVGTKETEDTKKDNEKYPVVKPNKTEVVNKDKLTQEEKDKITEEVKKVNTNAKDIEVKDNGDTIITYPDGSINELKQVDTVVQKKAEDKRKDNEKYPAQKPIRTAVEDKSDLTYREKERVTERIKDVNPHALAVSVKDNGDATLIYADGSTNELKQKDTVYELGESRKPDVDKVYEGDKYITGKGEPYASIDIKLPNGKIVSGSTDRYGYFKIKVPAKVELKEDDVIYVSQTEFESEESDRVKVTVLKNDKVDKKLKTEQHYAYIVGYPDGRFGPNDIITRAQTAMIFARLSRNQNAAPASYFSDINSKDWYAKAVGIGIQEGFIKGYVDGTFKPNQPMTRAEFASVISAFAEKETKRSNYKDVDGWAAGVIDTAYINGWMKGDGRGYFRPNDYITRAEAISVVNRVLKRNPDKEFIDKHILTSSTLLARPFTDVDMNSWYFYDVYAAAFGHDYKIKDKVEKWTELNGKVFTVR